MSYDNEKTRKATKWIKIIYIILSLVTIAGYIVSLQFELQTEVLKLYIASIFFICSVAIQVSVSAYISRVKSNDGYKSENRKLRYVSVLISLMLFLKGIDILIVYIADKSILDGDAGEEGFKTFVNVIKLVFYFIETGKSTFNVVIAFLFYCSNNILKMVTYRSIIDCTDCPMADVERTTANNRVL